MGARNVLGRLGSKRLGWLWLALLCLPLRSGASAPAGQYAVNLTDGLVTDNKTGLIWQRGFGASNYFADNFSYCASLSLGALTTGWRMPTPKELLTLVDETVASGTRIDAAAFGATPAEKFWANAPTAGDSGNIYGKWINFANGYLGGNPATGDNPINIGTSYMARYKVRCVHDP